MEHKKTYHSKEYITPIGTLVIEGPVSSETISRLDFDQGLVAFRIPEKQKQALIGIAKLPEGRIIIAREKNTIVGYVTFLYPDPLERWSETDLDNLLELGAIEITPRYRNMGVGKALLEVSFMDDAMEDYIVFTTEYYWHWDLKGTGLTVWQYREAMQKLMESAGLTWYATDDPEICSHPANCLMARLGKRTTKEHAEGFDRIRFQNRLIY